MLNGVLCQSIGSIVLSSDSGMWQAIRCPFGALCSWFYPAAKTYGPRPELRADVN